MTRIILGWRNRGVVQRPENLSQETFGWGGARAVRPGAHRVRRVYWLRSQDQECRFGATRDRVVWSGVLQWRPNRSTLRLLPVYTSDLGSRFEEVSFPSRMPVSST